MDNLKCGICLALFQDPRSLPCLHTFCRECIQRSLNEENHSLKCPMCRAKHELSEGAELLPVNQYALQELPPKRQREDNDGPDQLVECKSCGEQAGPVVAWCEDCDGVICRPCVDQHEKLVGLRDHFVKPFKKFRQSVSENDCELTDFPEKLNLFSKCLRHGNEKLKYLCTTCSELVCSDCLLLGSHAGHDKELVEEARPSLMTKMEELVSVTESKKQEFSEFLEKAKKAEGKALEYKEVMETDVNEAFDIIVASVEAQRDEALQSVSQGVKEVWSQKEMMEVSLAQLDSFTRYADHTHKCTTDKRFVAMAAQAIKLMEQLKDTHGDEVTLNRKLFLGFRYRENSRFRQLFSFGTPSLKFSPAPGTRLPDLKYGFNTVEIKVSLMIGKLPLFPPISTDKLAVVVTHRGRKIPAKVTPSNQSPLNIVFTINLDYSAIPLKINCKISEPATIEADITYKTSIHD